MKRLVCILLVTMVFVVGCGSGTLASEPTPTPIETPTPVPTPSFNMDEYKSKALELSDAIYAETELLLNMANFEVTAFNNFIKLGGFATGLKASTIESSLEIYGGTADDIKANSDKISKQYKEFFLIENDGSKEAIEIESNIKDMYENYRPLSELVTQEGANMNTFSSSAVEYGKVILSASENIKLFCEE